MPDDKDVLARLLSYSPEAGELRWLVSRGAAKAGDLAGYDWTHPPSGRRYRLLGVGGKMHRAHRVIWLLQTGSWPPPDMDVDHVNGDGLNNRWANLRLATRAQNTANSRLGKGNRSGFKGVSYYARAGKWRAVLGKKHLGLFDTPEEAHARYCGSAAEKYGEFARTA